MDHPKHIPVLLEEVLELLNPKPNDRYLDLTAGYGGHAIAVAEKIGEEGSITLVDRDQEAISHLKKTFKDRPNTSILDSDFLSASQELRRESLVFDVILADLGISSPHLNSPKRGFSFQSSGPLDMRMDVRQQKTVADIVNESSEEELAGILRDYGEINGALDLAKKIVQKRPYKMTTDLAKVAENVIGRSRIHPATRVFQALRIAVNEELKQLEESLPIWVELLKSGGRLGVISFHSLEDRLVKRSFQQYGGQRYDATLQTVTKKPVIASAEEVVFNPRARSAKLRVTQRK